MTDPESVDTAVPFSRQQSLQLLQATPGNNNSSGAPSGRFRFSFRKKSQKNISLGSPNRQRDAEDLSQRCSFITRTEAEQLRTDLITELGLTLDQMLEHGGLAAALAFCRMHPKESLSRDGALLVCCGPGSNGGYGLACARYLKIFGYKLTIFYPKIPAKPAYRQLLSQCEKLDIPFLSYMPGDVQVLQNNYSLIVDALFGCSFLAPMRSDLADVFAKLCDTAVPIASIDVPSGWEADQRPPITQRQLSPVSLISLFLPKRCSLEFQGRRHYIAGRMIPSSLASRLGIRLPAWGGSGELTVALVDVIAPPSALSERDATSSGSGSGVVVEVPSVVEEVSGGGGIGEGGGNDMDGGGGQQQQQQPEGRKLSSLNCF